MRWYQLRSHCYLKPFKSYFRSCFNGRYFGFPAEGHVGFFGDVTIDKLVSENGEGRHRIHASSRSKGEVSGGGLNQRQMVKASSGGSKGGCTDDPTPARQRSYSVNSTDV
jgi:hypothetical protein